MRLQQPHGVRLFLELYLNEIDGETHVTSKRKQIQKLLKGIETGDPEAATVVN